MSRLPCNRFGPREIHAPASTHPRPRTRGTRAGKLSANHHETHLSSFQGPACPHARVSRSHEDPRRPRSDQRPSRQGSQAPGRLKPAPLRVAVSAGSRTARIGRLVRSVDFERVLRTRTRMLSAHFALHHLAGAPSVPRKALPAPVEPDLSTGGGANLVRSVDDLPPAASDSPFAPVASSRPVPRLWLGAVVPKRHARRAVTRSLLKRQIDAAVATHADSMAAGLWVVRLRAGFDRASFASAASGALKRAAGAELDRLLRACIEPSAVRA